MTDNRQDNDDKLFLKGRGKAKDNHLANVYVRKIVRLHYYEYLEAPEKKKIADKVLEVCRRRGIDFSEIEGEENKTIQQCFRSLKKKVEKGNIKIPNNTNASFALCGGKTSSSTATEDGNNDCLLGCKGTSSFDLPKTRVFDYSDEIIETVYVPRLQEIMNSLKINDSDDVCEANLEHLPLIETPPCSITDEEMYNCPLGFEVTGIFEENAVASMEIQDA